MTLRELVEVAKDDGSDKDWPLQAMFAITGAIRSKAHREPATFDGECSGIVALMKNGYLEEGPVTEESLEDFMQRYPNLLDIDVPDDVLREWCNADNEE